MNKVEFHTRRVNPSQLAAISALIDQPEFMISKRGRPKKGTTHNGTTRDKWSQIIGVSARYIQEAKLINSCSPDLINDVVIGKISIPEARRTL